jgi:hypothetical protein
MLWKVVNWHDVWDIHSGTTKSTVFEISADWYQITRRHPRNTYLTEKYYLNYIQMFNYKLEIDYSMFSQFYLSKWGIKE